jgi:hypothetical protein
VRRHHTEMATPDDDIGLIREAVATACSKFDDTSRT